MKKIWKLKELNLNNGIGKQIDFSTFYDDVKDKVKLSETLLRLLYLRGITSHLDIIKFFKPQLERLYDPFLMKDMDKACNRVLKAIYDKEDVMITGDYDVDGTCGASMLHLFLKEFGVNTEIYIPDRESEGYGISTNSINLAKEKGIKLIIAVDFGITAIDKIDFANSLDIDFIICDHHQPREKIPDALAVLNPMRNDCPYPFKHLCGSGVAFKLIQAICKKLNRNEIITKYLDLVAIATASDISPVIDENRILISTGFDLMNNSPRPSIKTLMSKIHSGSFNKINTSNIIYTIAPRLNAVGRLGDAKRAVEFLLCEDKEQLNLLSSELDDTNTDRREMDQEITRQAIEMFEQKYSNDNPHCIVLHKDDWHPGVIGIVAARLVEKYNLPSIVLSTINGVAKGSARSNGNFNIYDALKLCEDYLIQFGGHFYAAGLEMKVENIDKFREKFDKIASEKLEPDKLSSEFEYEVEIKFQEIDTIFMNVLEYFEPYGPGNPVPIFMSKNLVIGDGIKHFKNYCITLRLTDPASDISFEANLPYEEKYLASIKPGVSCDVCYTVDVNRWNNYPIGKLRIKDIKFN